LLESLDFSKPQEKDNIINLRNLLGSDTTGKELIKKSETGQNLCPRDRACIVKLVVEKELKSLQKIGNTIRKDVWIKWADEVVKLFPKETSSIYYVPYNVVEGRVTQASGLIHNRLITHRRSLGSDRKRRASSSSSSESSDSGCQSNKSDNDGAKRNRPLPDTLIQASSSDSDKDLDIDWLKGSSSPEETVNVKWQNTFHQRNKLLASLPYEEYFNTFPALLLPTGYQLVSFIIFFYKLLFDNSNMLSSLKLIASNIGIIIINYSLCL
jgi:hypothetical protein